MGGDAGIHLRLHGLAGLVEGIKGRAGGLGPILGKREGNVPFLQLGLLGGGLEFFEGGEDAGVAGGRGFRRSLDY